MNDREKYKYIYFVNDKIAGIFSNRMDSKYNIKNHPDAEWCEVYTTCDGTLVSCCYRENNKIHYKEIV